MERLPIDDILPQVVSHLSTAGALVLKAEPGAGKTTRVPPAILDAGLSMMPDKSPGQIVVLQPRRVAARSAAARMSEERGTILGADIGYCVRHEGRSSFSTRILVCTVGVFLRRLQEDPSIEDVAVVIFDEFHERSVDSDLALALSRQVKQQIRPDLAIVVMSATLESTPIAAYLGDCPTIECPGRTFPIAIEYLSHPANQPIDRLAADGVERMIGRTSGDLLVFLPGVDEIHKTQANLQAAASNHNLVLMPLYGDMPLPAQQAVLQPCKQRKVVLATNVAETSLTIDGVTAVIDSGHARINRFDPGIGFNRLELSRISKASATQRAGRAGRTVAGSCLRLWSEREQRMLADFELPEIERLELSQCVLQLMAWGEQDVYVFPWFEKPPVAAIDKALELLDRLGAVSSGSLTALGRAMSRLPLQPRLARLLVEGARLGQPKRAALCAALLSERPPFKSAEPLRRGGHQTERTGHTDSDVLEQVRSMEAFADSHERHSIMGEILPGAAKQILRAAEQLCHLLDDSDGKWESKAQSKTQTQTQAQTESETQKVPAVCAISADESILRAIMVAFPDRICKRRQPKEQRGVMVGGRGIKLAETSTVCDAPLFAAVDMIDLNKAELSVRRASAVEIGWLPESLLATSIDVVYDSSRQKVVALRRTRFCDLVLDETIASMPAEIDTGAVLAEAVLANFELATLVDQDALDFFARVQCLREWLPELDIPDFGINPWLAFLPDWCLGCTSIAELRGTPLTEAIKASLTAEQIAAVARHAPEHISMRGGRRVKLQYEPGKPPVLAARIQELFGLAQTPRIANARVPVLMHVLAPNYRVQQITPDLSSFWKNTYPGVKKQLQGRYPKHAWPDDPLKP